MDGSVFRSCLLLFTLILLSCCSTHKDNQGTEDGSDGFVSDHDGGSEDADCDDSGGFIVDEDVEVTPSDAKLHGDPCPEYPTLIERASNNDAIELFNSQYARAFWEFFSTGDVRSIWFEYGGVPLYLPTTPYTQEEVDLEVKRFVEEWRDLLGFGTEGLTLQEFHTDVTDIGVSTATIRYIRDTVADKPLLTPLRFHVNISNGYMFNIIANFLREPSELVVCDRLTEALLPHLFIGRDVPLGPEGRKIFQATDHAELWDKGVYIWLPELVPGNAEVALPASYLWVYRVWIYSEEADQPGCAYAIVDAGTGTILFYDSVCIP